jgi:hypothetical protein
MDIVRPAAALLLAFAAAAGHAQPQPSESSAIEPDIAALKRQYLECDRQASRQRLDPTSASQCSIVSELLLQRAFAGDFERLLVWWREARDAPQAVQPMRPRHSAIVSSA